MPLTEKEKAELEILDDPRVEHFSSGMGGLFSMFGLSSNRRHRVVILRTKMRMDELMLDQDKNPDDYVRIRHEEEIRFDQRFAKK